MAFKATAQDLQDEVEAGDVVRAIENGEGAQAQDLGDFAGLVAVGAGALDGDHGRGFVEAVQDFEQARAAFLELGVGVGLDFFEGQAEVHKCDVDAVGADDLAGLRAAAGAEAEDAHGLQESGEAIDPRVGLPAGVGEQQVEAGAAAACGPRCGIRMWARTFHPPGLWATRVPDGGGSGVRRRAGRPLAGRQERGCAGFAGRGEPASGRAGL